MVVFQNRTIILEMCQENVIQVPEREPFADQGIARFLVLYTRNLHGRTEGLTIDNLTKVKYDPLLINL